MKNAITLGFAVGSLLLASFALGAAPTAPAPGSRAAAIGRLMQEWQSRILASNLPVDDAKNWSRRNLARFSRLDGDRLSLAQRASTLGELELVLAEAPIPDGSHLDILLASAPEDITMMASMSDASKSSPATSPASYSNLVFTALNPCRILDSRISQGGMGPWAAGSTHLIKIGPYSTAGGGYATGPGAQGGSATSCGLDTLASTGEVAVIMAAVSTVNQGGAGFLTFFPQGSPNPGGASVSQWYQPGYVQTSFVLIPTDLVGTVAASGYTSSTTEVIIDVMGYFSAAEPTGIVAVENGGTGQASLTNNGVVYGQGTAAVGTAVGGAGQVLAGTAGAPAFTSSPSITGSLNLSSASSSTAGNIMKSGSRFVHNFGSANTFVGLNAGNFSMSGGFNTALGASALDSNTSGLSNTAIGYGALGGNSSGSNNVAIGSSAGQNLTTGSNNIIIGTSGTAGDSQTTRIGSGQTKVFITGIRGITTGASNAITVLIDANGQLGTASSSARVKDDIADMGDATARLMKLRPVTFQYKAYGPQGTRQYGLIAEEVEAVYPELVAHSADGQTETVMYHVLPSMLLNEYQKQQRTIEALREQVDRLARSLEAGAR